MESPIAEEETAGPAEKSCKLCSCSNSTVEAWRSAARTMGLIRVMILKRLGFVWKILPGWLRLKIIRTTQAKFTVSAAAIITNEERQVLLLNHALRPFSGWGLPGGFVGVREQPEEAIRREIREETGLELNELEMFSIRTIGQHVEILFTAKAVGTAEVMSREILELGWFDIGSMPEQMSRSQKEVISNVVGGGAQE